MKKNILIMGLFISQTAFSAILIKSQPNASEIQFEAIGRPSMIKIKGVGNALASSINLNQNSLSGVIAFSLTSLKTGIDLRDEHMKEKYLQVKKYPYAKLTINQLSLPASWSLKNPKVSSLPFKAQLQLHGVTKDVTGSFVIEDEKLKTNAEFEINLSDFGIEIPSYLGVKVADVVKINVMLGPQVINQN